MPFQIKLNSGRAEKGARDQMRLRERREGIKKDNNNNNNNNNNYYYYYYYYYNRHSIVTHQRKSWPTSRIFTVHMIVGTDY